MFGQAVPGSQQTMDEYMHAPVDKVADDCWAHMCYFTKERALDVYEANPEGFKDALEGALERHSNERIVEAAVRAIQNDTRICWSDGLAEEDKLHVLWKHCQKCVLHSTGAPGPGDLDRVMDFKRNSASTSALSACMEVEKAISIAGSKP